MTGRNTGPVICEASVQQAGSCNRCPLLKLFILKIVYNCIRKFGILYNCSEFSAIIAINSNLRVECHFLKSWPERVFEWESVKKNPGNLFNVCN